MIIRNPFRNLSKFEWLLWLISISVIFCVFLLCGNADILTLVASLVGATALIFVSKGDVFGQVLTVIFSLLYSVISFELRYYGEMITYLGMTSPIAILSVIAWLKHPFETQKTKVKISEVKIHHLTRSQKAWMIVLTVLVTAVFYFILRAFHTANLFVSTISIATSFLASYLMLFRSPTYALAYGANDVVLITLWVMAFMKNSAYLPMVICFVIFLLNDLYGFYNWRKIKARQEKIEQFA